MASDDPGEMTLGDVEGRILEFIERELVGHGETITRDDDLLSGEIIDSIGVLRLSAFVEEHFEVKMQPSDLVVENFRSVSALAGFVLRARDAE